ncbi:flagellar basal body rod protein FlgC [Vulgatibacter incomptus]|uniref:Flagellar basal-body rod protein FlgC n=1 Tax=Vulgatibacter incomptus TaxID=1391653 RepID=A0A0K1PHN2_9BACT|nr:flagellar basal body rod protein FlgC [Vulgatibacter incomptus]AKU93030.1 Flagellar basal-body rod protein FlgC [Vulgatibacter incomptus]
MSFLTSLRIGASGLSAQRTRVDLATSNLANADTTRGPDGQPYRRLDPILEAVPFDQALGAAAPAGTAAVRIAGIAADPEPGRRIHSPSHPDADADGFVTLPNVDPIHEVVNLMSASRSYEANATAIETLKGMAQRALDIAR